MKLISPTVILVIFGVLLWHSGIAGDTPLIQQKLSLLPIKKPTVIEEPAKPAEKKSIWQYKSEPAPNGDQLISTISFEKSDSRLTFYSSLTSGRLTAPEGAGTRLSKGRYAFSDSFGNKGSIDIKHLSETEILVIFNITKVKEPRALFHYEARTYKKNH